MEIRIYEVIKGELTKIMVKQSETIKILKTKRCDPEEFINDKEEFIKSLEFVSKYLPIFEEEVLLVKEDVEEEIKGEEQVKDEVAKDEGSFEYITIAEPLKCCGISFDSYDELINHIKNDIEGHIEDSVIIGFKELGYKKIPILYQVIERIWEELNDHFDYKDVQRVVPGIDEQTAKAYIAWLEEKECVELEDETRYHELYPGTGRYRKVMIPDERLLREERERVRAFAKILLEDLEG